MAFIIAILFVLQNQNEVPAYISRGDEVEQRYRAYQEKLTSYYSTLRDELERTDKEELRHLTESPRSVTNGYQVLPRLVADEPPEALRPTNQKTEGRSYSWVNTEGFIAGEELKLSYAQRTLNDAAAAENPNKRRLLQRLAQEYRQLVQNQKTIDQYIQYNRFWQRAIYNDRARFDRMTKVYDLVTERERLHDTGGDGGEADLDAINRVLSDTLGPPQLPSFVEILRPAERRIVLRVPVYTDIEDQELLRTAEQVIEKEWNTSDEEANYSVDVVFRSFVVPDVPRGAAIDIAEHVRRFPNDGAVLTAGANTTYSYTGRYIALGTGPVPHRVIAHEFGHVLGFRDGYFRGYRDLGAGGFEILELALNFEDIMSAPREGSVHAFHFKMLLGSKR